MSHSRPRRPLRNRAVATIATAALVAGAVAATPTAALAAVPEGAITDAVFEWGLNAETGAAAFVGGCNFLSAGIAGDTTTSRAWTEADGFYKAADGNVRILKDGAAGSRVAPTWATKCQSGAGTAGSNRNTVTIADGTGTAHADGSFTIEWDGDFTVAYYGGMTYWSVSDPVLTVDASGDGEVTASVSGYASSRGSGWTPIPATPVVLADLSDVDAGATGFTATPDYLGVTTTASGQSRTGDVWGSFPQSFVDFQVLTGQSSFWYSSGSAKDADKVATPLTVSYGAPHFVSSPVSKTATLGDAVTLTAATLGTSTFQWQSAPVGSDTWTDVAGATSSSLVLTATSAAALRYRVVATDAAGTATSTAATLTVDVPTPTVTVSKASGLDRAGETVTVTGSGFLPNSPLTDGSRRPLLGTFTGAYIALAARNLDLTGTPVNHTNALSPYTTWGVHADSISAIGGTGTVIGADGTFSAEIRAEDFPLAEGQEWGIRTYAAGGVTYAPFSTFTPVRFAVDSAVPALVGTAVVDGSVSVDPGTWQDGATLSYQWLRGGAPISGATSATYRPVAADAGAALSVRVSGAQAGYTTAAQTSASVKVAKATLKSAATTISGTAKVGSKLTAKKGTWTAGTSFTYRWYVGGKQVAGASKSTYTVKAADRGKTVKARVIGSKPGYSTAFTTSAATKKVAAGTLKSATPKISGTAKAGKKLTAVKGTWTSGTKFSYQWYVGGKAVKGATKSTYTVKSADRGKNVVVKVKGSKSGYTSVSKKSAPKRVAR